jgi:uncharacterized protein (DUF427 family)
MKAVLNDRVVAESADIVEVGGYAYFPLDAVRPEVRLEPAPKTDHDKECPHGVRFYDVVLDGKRHARNAWIYEAPLPKMQATARRVGFWEDVKVV